MKIRSLFVAAVLAGVATGVAVVPTAGAATTGNTTATFTLSAAGGGLAITVPASTVALATVSTGATSASGSLGTVTVTDTRAALAATWTTTVSSTTFTTGGASANETVALADVGYASGAGTAASGNIGAFVPLVNTPMSALAAARTMTWAGVGNNTVSWNPTVTFTLLTSQVAGTYTGTITHSVA
jgi:hypothetical protein